MLTSWRWNDAFRKLGDAVATPPLIVQTGSDIDEDAILEFLNRVADAASQQRIMLSAREKDRKDATVWQAGAANV